MRGRHDPCTDVCRYEPVLSQTIVASVDAVLASSTPSFLESIRLTTFTCQRISILNKSLTDPVTLQVGTKGMFHR